MLKSVLFILSLMVLGSAIAAEQELTHGDLLASVSADGAMEHLIAFQKIADENNGNRSAGTRGHELSANYVAQKLMAAGYEVKLHAFNFEKFSKIAPGMMELRTPTQIKYEEGKQFGVMTYSPSGEITAAVTAVDVMLGPDNKSTSGCEAQDFANFPRGNIALIQRGTCPFGQKAKNAMAAGASGAIIFNQGDQESRKELLIGTLSADRVTIPVVATTYDVGASLVQAQNPTVYLQTSTKIEQLQSYNVIADSKTGNPNNIVAIGAHLDGVDEGPGMNDNGSGSAGILEVALKMRNLMPNNKLRFAWWSAEELGLVGSTKYVESLSAEEKAKIALYLNFDMIASPNYILGVYDGDGSKTPPSGPAGSGAIEKLFHMFFSVYGPGSVETPMNGRSDYAAFATAGIPVGGTFTGAEGTKTEEEARLFGGTAGEAYDKCYHKACDNMTNLNTQALEINTDAIAFMALTYGHSTSSVPRSSFSSGFTPSKSLHIDGVGEAFLE
ncbi:MAG: M28 family metallopeptidase [Bdellovibrionales bacterium]